jgi:hypothetical protein
MTARWPGIAAIIPFIPVVLIWTVIAESGVFPRAFFPVRRRGALVHLAYLQGHPAGLSAGA